MFVCLVFEREFYGLKRILIPKFNNHKSRMTGSR